VRACIVLLVSSFLFVCALLAPSPTAATIRGRVVGPSDAVVSTAIVAVTDVETNVSYSSATNDDGF